jgi:ubiquinone biosynthesis protein COQ4
MTMMSGAQRAEFSGLAAFRGQRIKPLAAALAAIRLIRDNEDTAQVARLSIALTGKSQAKIFARFMASPVGQKIITERRSLAKTLSDHHYLATLPENSLGRHYLAMMQREALSAQGLVDATPDLTAHLAHLPEEIRLFTNYTQRDSHDLHHILAGYGRDELGEVCVLAMTYEHLNIRGYRVIFTIGPLVIRRHLRRIGVPAQGVFAAVREARRIGRNSAWLAGLDIESILPEDLDALRARLNIARPVIYNSVIARIKSHTAWQNGPLSTLPGK